MALPAIIAAGVGVVQGVQTLSGGSGKDPERLAANQDAYARALQGDVDAALFLKQRTGQFGIVRIASYGGDVGGWATQVARADAEAKWRALQGTAQVQQGLSTATSTVVEKVEKATGRKILALTPTQQFLAVAALGLAAWAGYRFILKPLLK